jgi:hypothetical protein
MNIGTHGPWPVDRICSVREPVKVFSFYKPMFSARTASFKTRQKLKKLLLWALINFGFKHKQVTFIPLGDVLSNLRSRDVKHR